MKRQTVRSLLNKRSGLRIFIRTARRKNKMRLTAAEKLNLRFIDRLKRRSTGAFIFKNSRAGQSQLFIIFLTSPTTLMRSISSPVKRITVYIGFIE